MANLNYLLQVEATGNEEVANNSINYVRRGGTLMIYGVYSDIARVHWPPSKIFGDEIKVCRIILIVHFFLIT
jgi:D-arabinitol dehydrogenase (NADP+)